MPTTQQTRKNYSLRTAQSDSLGLGDTVGILAAADSAYRAGKPEQALSLLDFISAEANGQAQLLRRSLEARISKRTLPYVQWEQRTQWLTLDGQRVARINPGSAEGLFLQILMRSLRTKSAMSKTLWPTSTSVGSNDGRLSRLNGRLRKKLGAVVQFDGSEFRLYVTIEMI